MYCNDRKTATYFIQINILFILLIILFFLPGCQKKEEQITADEYVPGKDYQYMYFATQDGNRVAETEDGYYFSLGQYLFFMDKESGEAVALCNKPNCLHNKETDPAKRINCNAFFMGGIFELSYYDEQLYCITQKDNEYHQKDPILIKIEKDGTSRKEIVTFDKYPDNLIFHRGKIYYTNITYQTDQENNSNAIYSMDIEGGESEIIYRDEENVKFLDDMRAYGNHLYVRCIDYVGGIYILHYDLVTKEMTQLDPKLSTQFAIADNKLYFSVFKTDANEKIVQTGNYCSGLDGSSLQGSFETDSYVWLSGDGKLIYCQDLDLGSEHAKDKEEQSLIIYDTNGNKLDTIMLNQFDGQPSFLPGGEDHLFFYGNRNGKIGFYCADKKDIGKGITCRPVVEDIFENLYPEVVIENN